MIYFFDSFDARFNLWGVHWIFQLDGGDHMAQRWFISFDLDWHRRDWVGNGGLPPAPTFFSGIGG